MAHYPRVTPEQRQVIVDAIKSGMWLTQIVQATRASTFTIYATAKFNGLTINKAPPSMYATAGKKGGAAAHKAARCSITVVPAEMSLEQHWKGMKASMRW